MSDRPATIGAMASRALAGAPLARAPALTMAFALAGGILFDRLAHIDWAIWLVGLLTLLVVAAWRTRLIVVSTCCTVALWFCIGGARHHWAWSVRRADDVSRYATTDPQPVKLTGTLLSSVEFHPPEDDPFTPSWMRRIRSTCTVDAEQLLTGGERVNVSGRVRLEVSGRLQRARVGDPVSITGRLILPGRTGNPGGFDYRAWLRRQRIGSVVRVSHPDAVTVLPDHPALSTRLARLRNSLRTDCRDILNRELSPEHVPLAASLLIGDRTGLTDDLQTAFARSGTMHLLAISGLHVGILAGLVFIVCRLLNVGPAGTAVTVLFVVWLYAFVTDHRPPVLRASVLVTIVVSGSQLYRVINGVNALAVSAVLILLWSPTALFDVGAQLSFLAVAGILWSARIQRECFNTNASDDPLRPEPGRLMQWLGPVFRWLRAGYVITFSIWLFALPLVMARFHLASPVGFVLNVVLIPLITLTLASGFLLLLFGFMLPLLAPAAGFVFDWCLWLLLWIAEGAAGWGPGHTYVSGPSDWWLIGFYACLGAATRIVPVPVSASRVWKVLAVWIIAGLIAGLIPPRRDGLRCTFLDVGHGCGILVECPDGKTLLYDAGTLGNGRRAQQIIQNALWNRGLHRLDVVVISHADVDHFNGLAGLMETTLIDQVLISRPFLDFNQGSVVAVCDAAARHGIDLRLIQAGDRLRLDPDVGLLLLHPADGFEGEADNENSNVLQIDYAGRSILLTGDLEGAGLNELLNTSPRDVDVLLSPHHGSRAANPAELDDWAQPEFVIISTGDFGVAEQLSPVFGDDCRVLSTKESGAVTVRVPAVGGLHVEEFKN